MISVDSVFRQNEQSISGGRDRAAAHVMLGDSEFAHHIKTPNDIRFVFGIVFFGLD